jgi:hypothetical protein
MKGQPYKRTLKQLGFSSQSKAADFFGFTTRQSRRIAAGTAELRLAERKLIAVMLHYGITKEMVEQAMKPSKAPRAAKPEKAAA